MLPVYSGGSIALTHPLGMSTLSKLAPGICILMVS